MKTLTHTKRMLFVLGLQGKGKQLELLVNKQGTELGQPHMQEFLVLVKPDTQLSQALADEARRTPLCVQGPAHESLLHAVQERLPFLHGASTWSPARPALHTALR